MYVVVSEHANISFKKLRRVESMSIYLSLLLHMIVYRNYAAFGRTIVLYELQSVLQSIKFDFERIISERVRLSSPLTFCVKVELFNNEEYRFKKGMIQFWNVNWKVCTRYNINCYLSFQKNDGNSMLGRPDKMSKFSGLECCSWLVSS